LTTIDFTRALNDAKGASFEALPVGDYDVEVAKTEATTSSNGKPMIKVNMKVVTGPYERRPIINNFVMSVENPQAVAIFFRHMKAFGLTEEFFASLGSSGSLDPVASALVGRRVRLSLGHREWNGEMRNEVKSVKPYTGAPPMAGPTAPGGPTPPGLPLASPPVAGPAPLPPAPVAAPAVPTVTSAEAVASPPVASTPATSETTSVVTTPPPPPPAMPV
jgi:hypothetical protein